MRTRMKKVWLPLLLISTVLIGCSRPDTINEQEEANGTDGAVIIPVMFRVNPETDQRENENMVAEFNQKYEGKYQIEVQWVTATEQGYREKVRVLNALDKLPAVITDVAFSPALYKSMSENGRFVNLRPFMEASGKWGEMIDDVSMESCVEKNGEIYLSPVDSGLFSSAGIFYNESLLLQAGIEEFPTTWEAFFEMLDILKQQGITPLSLHGGGTYWAAMLIATAYMSSEETGSAFLAETLPDSYNNASMKQLLECVDLLFDYTTSDVLELDFYGAAERFYQGETAMIANGYWMMADIPGNIKNQVGFAPFPENTMMVSPNMSSWAVVSGYNNEVTEGAVEFLKYRYLSSTLEPFGENSLEQKFCDTFRTIEHSYPNYQLRWKDSIQNEFFDEMIPELLTGNVGVDEILRKMNQQ